MAFLGLGRMGAPMARRLDEAGHDVTVWNRTAAKAERFPKRADTPVDTVAGGEVVITMLADPQALRDVVFGSGVVHALRPDAVLVDMSTVGPAAARRVHEAVPQPTLDAPVGGGVTQAAEGSLVVLVGGEDSVLRRVRRILEVFGDVVRCGGPGAGQAMKLVFNAVLAVTMCGIGEAVALGERQGVDVRTILRVLERGGAAPMVARKGPMIAARDYAASFALSLMRKDAGLVMEAAAEVGAKMPLAAVAADTYRMAEGRGLGEEDYAAIAELFRPPAS